MKMISVHAGKLRAIGYDNATRTLCVEMDNGQGLEHTNVGESIWRQFRDSGNQWSYYQDNIQEEYTAKQRKTRQPTTNQKNPLDDLFK